MDSPAVIIQKKISRSLLLLLGLTLLAGCANTPPAAPRAASGQPLIPPVRSQEPFVQGNLQELQKLSSPPAVLKTPDYQPVSDDVSPAQIGRASCRVRV